MIPLVKKDIANMKTSLLILFGIFILFTIYGVINDQRMMIPLLCALFPLIITGVSCGYDYSSKFEQMAFAMPVTRRDYVFSKLFFAFVFALLGGLVVFFILQSQPGLGLRERLVIGGFSAMVTLLLSSVQLPFILKYGAEKGRLITVITYALIFAASSFFKETIELIIGFFRDKPFITIGLSAILIGLVLVLMATQVSIKVMENKEY